MTPDARATTTGDPRARRRLAGAIAAGVLASLFYFAWWLEDGRIADPLLGVAFVLAAVYVGTQIYCAWFVYLHIARPTPVPAPSGLTVDVFIPVYDEPFDLVERSLAAAVAMTYPHRTYLLDDARDPKFEALAARLGARYVRRDDHRDAKAGNVNAALADTDGEFVVVFDVDHVAEPDFLDAVLGYFGDPNLGFVQSGVAFRNRGESDVARATAGQAYDVYGPTSMGMSGCGAAPVWGSHTTFRRRALDAIGGYQAGLAEDLHTSLTMHANGWRSLYEPSIHAWGLVPSDVLGFTKQQLKWARGVFAMWVDVFPWLATRLGFARSCAYLVRLTYYLIGPLFLAHVLAALRVLFGGVGAAGFASYLLHALPMGIAVILVRSYVNAVWNPHEAPTANRFNWRGYAQAGALWPIYTVALVCAFLHIPIPHIATPKERVEHAHPLLVAPQMALCALIVAAVVWRCAAGATLVDVPVMLFALATVGAQLPTIHGALRP
jgi:cellulose synthase/poly-beta-1,6-N-acetylglucosamine synthase-like glycosyltransferase